MTGDVAIWTVVPVPGLPLLYITLGLLLKWYKWVSHSHLEMDFRHGPNNRNDKSTVKKRGQMDVSQ